MVGGSSPEAGRIGSITGRGDRTMEYFAGLDVSMAETHVCVVTRNGAVIHQAKVPSTPADIAAELAQVPTCRRVLFETGRMAPMLYHGLSRLGLPVVCVESRQVLSGTEVVSDAQDRPQRCTRPGASRPHRLLQTRSCEVTAGTRPPVANHCSQKASRRACA